MPITTKLCSPSNLASRSVSRHQRKATKRVALNVRIRVVKWSSRAHKRVNKFTTIPYILKEAKRGHGLTRTI